MNVCPECGSKDIEEDDSSDFMFNFLLGIPIATGICAHDFSCTVCGHRWSR